MIKATAQGNIPMTAEEVALHLASQPTEAQVLQDAKDAKCRIINEKTKDEIVNIAGSDAKQRNYLAKYNELLAKKIEGVTLTEEEVVVLTTLKTLWVQIEMLVNEGNAKEAQIQTLSTIDEVTSFVI